LEDTADPRLLQFVALLRDIFEGLRQNADPTKYKARQAACSAITEASVYARELRLKAMSKSEITSALRRVVDDRLRPALAMVNLKPPRVLDACILLPGELEPVES
jgi:hypothetical protein